MGVEKDAIIAMFKSIGVEVKSSAELIKDRVDAIMKLSELIYDSPAFRNIAMMMVPMTEEEIEEAFNYFKEQLEKVQKLKSLDVTVALDETDKKEEA